MDAIKCSFSFLHRTKLNIIQKISAPNLRRHFRSLSLSAKDRRSSEAETVVVVENLVNQRDYLYPMDFLHHSVPPSETTASISLFTLQVPFPLPSSLSDLRQNKVTEEIKLDPSTYRTGHVWHVFLRGDFKDMVYGYRFDGKFSPEEGHSYDFSNILSDPYAKAIISRDGFGVLGADENCWPQIASVTLPSFSFH